MKENNFSRILTVQLLKLLKESEPREFLKWLQSPWCNRNQKLVPLYQILRKHSPQFSSIKLTKQSIFSELYVGQTYNDKIMRNLLGELSSQIRQFLVIKQLRKDTRDFHKGLISLYAQRASTKWFIKKSNTFLQDIETTIPRSWEDILDRVLINERLYFSPQTIFRQQELSKPLDDAEAALDEFYLLGKLRILIEKLEREKKFTQSPTTVNSVIDRSFLTPTAIEQIIRHPVMKLYYERLQTEKLPPLLRFKAVEQTFWEEVDQLSKKDLRILLLYLINDASRLSQTGDTVILNKALALYKFAIDRKVVYQQDMITESTFLNIVSLAAGLKDFDFLTTFLETHLPCLPEIFVRDARIWSKARIALEVNEFEDCIAALKDEKFDHFVFTYRSRLLLLQAYFEQSMIDDSYFPLFKNYCHRTENNFRNEKRLSSSRKVAIIKFVQYTRKIGKWKDGLFLPVVKLDRIAADLHSETNIQGKYWLENKIKQCREERK